jgi:hypothetical protein
VLPVASQELIEKFSEGGSRTMEEDDAGIIVE